MIQVEASDQKALGSAFREDIEEEGQTVWESLFFLYFKDSNKTKK